MATVIPVLQGVSWLLVVGGLVGFGAGIFWGGDNTPTYTIYAWSIIVLGLVLQRVTKYVSGTPHGGASGPDD